MGVQSVQGHVLSTDATDGKTDRNGLGYFFPATPPGEGRNSAWCVPARSRTEPGDAVCFPAAQQLPARVKCELGLGPWLHKGVELPQLRCWEVAVAGDTDLAAARALHCHPKWIYQRSLSSHLLSLAKQTRLGENKFIPL